MRRYFVLTLLFAVLVGTQWATGALPGGAPPFVANPTMETFIQDKSSCMGCHKFAQTTSGQSADFSFLLGEAR